ncbi:MAG: hypothetical protein ACREUK_01260, partial [Burkholderiales bacterium]
PAGTSGLAPADPSQPPQETNGIPQVSPAPPGTTGTDFVAGDQRTSTGDPIIPVIPLQSGSGYAAAVAFEYSGAGYGSPYVYGTAPVDAVFSTSGQLTDVTLSSYDHYTLQPGGSNADFGTDGILAWGRWIGPVGGTYGCDGACGFSPTYDANTGLHYVIGMPTPVMPTSGSAIFTMIGATSPTYVDGHVAPGTFNGSLEVQFSATPTVGMNFNITMPDGSWDFAGTATGSGSLFSGGATSSTGCCCGCTASVQGFFAGANAARAGIGYQASVDTGNVVGAAAFKNTGVPVPPR